MCDHTHGKLLLCDEGRAARCPLHGWELDTATLAYRNIGVSKKTIPFRQEEDRLYYSVQHSALEFPEELRSAAPLEVTVRFLAHACLAIEVAGKRLVMDPWLVGPCFSTGWWHKVPPKSDALDLLRHADLIYISHNHPDHMHSETLSYLRRDVPIIVPDFTTNSAVRPLRRMGFTSVFPLEFNHIYSVLDANINVSILQAGDFRDDSGLFLSAGRFSMLSTVDSNRLNNLVLPHGVDLLTTSFASGSSGYPLCFEMLPEKERFEIVERNRRIREQGVVQYVKTVEPRVYMPYAGYFTEAAPRDAFVRENNRKNTSGRIIEILAAMQNVKTVDPMETDSITFAADGQVRTDVVPAQRLYQLNEDYVDSYIGICKAQAAQFDTRVIRDYFLASNFRDQLVVRVVPTNDVFTPVANHEGVRVDFRGEDVQVDTVPGQTLVEEFVASQPDGHRLLLIKARIDSLWHVITRNLPLEELSIGFQCRINRKPDIYNSAFWYHFTNVYNGELEDVAIEWRGNETEKPSCVAACGLD
jgi:CMP-N-acetylneuraminate monooxygenase